MDKVREKTNVDLKRLLEEIEHAHSKYGGASSMGAYNVKEEQRAKEGDYPPNTQPRSETKVE